MVMHPRLRYISGVAAAASVPMVGAAQASFGFTLGSAKISDVRSQRGLPATLQYQVGSWLTLSAVPAYVHVSNGTVSSTGLGDLPLVAGAAPPLARAAAPAPRPAPVAPVPPPRPPPRPGARATPRGGDAGRDLAPRAPPRLS